MTTCIAAIAADRSVWTLTPSGKSIAHGAIDIPLIWGGWDVQATESAPFSWPTWSSDAKHIACFRLPGKGRNTAALYVLDADGVQAREIADLGDRLPIYLFWAPGDQHVAVLTQKGTDLSLTVFSISEHGQESHMATGSPLFFTWAGPSHVAAFVGNPTAGPQMQRMAIGGNRGSTILPGRPGNFCAPLWMGERAVFVHHEPNKTQLVTSSALDAELHVLENLEGLIAMAASPDGRTIARAVATDGDGTPYRQLGLVDVVSGEVRELSDAPCLAYMWSPDGQAIITARVDTRKNLLSWQRIGLDGEVTPLAELYPSRDLGFYLRFFEQYSQSHHLMDPSGRYLLLPGNMLGQGDPNGPGRLWRVDLHNGETEDIADGVFGVYAPKVAG